LGKERILDLLRGAEKEKGGDLIVRKKGRRNLWPSGGREGRRLFGENYLVVLI